MVYVQDFCFFIINGMALHKIENGKVRHCWTVKMSAFEVAGPCAAIANFAIALSIARSFLMSAFPDICAPAACPDPATLRTFLVARRPAGNAGWWNSALT
jgi:hypothetical protein